MFQMTVDSIIKVGKGNVSFGGRCVNKDKFTGILSDENGNRYSVYIPLSVEITPEDDETIMLCSHDTIDDIKSLKGRVLRGIS